MAVRIDQYTKNLGLPLPNVRNDQTDDCGRIAQSLARLDEAHGQTRLDMAALKEQVGDDLNVKLTGIETSISETKAAADAAQDSAEAAKALAQEAKDAAGDASAFLGKSIVVEADGNMYVISEDESAGGMSFSISRDGYLEVTLNG